MRVVPIVNSHGLEEGAVALTEGRQRVDVVLPGTNPDYPRGYIDSQEPTLTPPQARQIARLLFSAADYLEAQRKGQRRHK